MNIDQEDKGSLMQHNPLGSSSVRRVLLNDIMDSEREIIICHQDDEYRLRLTSNNKLLLTK